MDSFRHFGIRILNWIEKSNENGSGYTHLSTILESDTNMDIQIHVSADIDTRYLFSHFHPLVTWPPMKYVLFEMTIAIVIGTSIFLIGNLATNLFVSCT